MNRHDRLGRLLGRRAGVGLAALGGVLNQPMPIGADTLAQAGRFKPVNANDNELVVTAITGGTLQASYGIYNGGVARVSGTPASDNGGTLIVTAAGIEDIVLTVIVEADAFSVSSVAEMDAVDLLGAVSINNHKIRLRRAEYDVSASNSWWTNAASSSATVTFASHDVDAWDGVFGSTPHERVKLIWDKDNSGTNRGAPKKVTFTGLCHEGQFDRRNSPSFRGAILLAGTGLEDLKFEKGWLKGDNDVIGKGSSYEGFLRGDGSFDAMAGDGLTLDRMKVSHLSIGLLIQATGEKTVTNCEVTEFFGDAISIGQSGQLTVNDNFIHTPGSDAYGIYSLATNQALISARTFTGASNSQTGLFHFRFTASSSATRYVGFAMQPSTGGALTCALEKTTGDKIRFFAKDTGGTVVIDMTTTNSIVANVQHNVLVSVDTTGTSRLHMWQEGGKQGRAADVETVTDTAASETMDWTDAVVSTFAEDDGSSGAANWTGQFSLAAFWPGQTADLTDADVRANFYNPDNNGEVRQTEAFAEYGTPILYTYGTLTQWRGPSGVNQGSGDNLILRTVNTSIDTFHVDGIQAITNTGTTARTSMEDMGPITIERNVFFAGRLGVVSVETSQGIFFEDILGAFKHLAARVKNNLFILSGPHAISLYNAEAAFVAHNTVISHPDMEDTPSNDKARIQMKIHDDYGMGVRQDVTSITGTIAEGDVVAITGYPDDAKVFEIIDANTLQLWKWDGSNYVVANDLAISDGMAMSFSPSGATATADGDTYSVTPAGIAAASARIRSNLTQGVVDEHDSSVDALDAGHGNDILATPITADISTYFDAPNGFDLDGGGFASYTAIKATMATKAAVNPTGLVAKGWDAYESETSPWEGTCAAFTVTDLTSQDVNTLVESGFFTIGSLVGTNGIAVAAVDSAGDAVEMRLYDSGGTAITGWTTEPILYDDSTDQLKVRETSSTLYSTQLDVTVVAGDKTDTWSITTEAPPAMTYTPNEEDELHWGDPTDDANLTLSGNDVQEILDQAGAYSNDAVAPSGDEFQKTGTWSQGPLGSVQILVRSSNTDWYDLGVSSIGGNALDARLGGDSWTMFLALQDVVATTGAVFGRDNTHFGVWQTAGMTLRCAVGGTYTASSTTWTTGSNNLLCVWEVTTGTGGSAGSDLWVNGVQEISGGLIGWSAPSGNIRLGFDTSGPAFEIGAYGIINGTPSTALRENLEGYMAWKHDGDGTTSLPSGHTYENAPPMALRDMEVLDFAARREASQIERQIMAQQFRNDIRKAA